MAVVYAGAPISTGGQSPNIWGHCPWTTIKEDPGRGFAYEQQFTNIGPITTGALVDGILGYVDGAGTITVPAGNYSALALLTAGVNNNEASIGLGTHTTPATSHGPVELTASRKLWFEARVAVSSLTTIAAYVGLARPAQIADSGLADDGTSTAPLGAVPHIGFRLLEAETEWDAVHNDDAAADLIINTSAFTAVAATGIENQANYTNFGLYYDGARMHYYVDNASVGSVARTATDFPPATTELTPFIAVKTHVVAGATRTLWCDWFKIAQLWE